MFNPAHTAQHILMKAVHENDLTTVRLHLSDVRTTWDPNEILCYACQKGRLEIVQELLTVADPNCDLGRPLQQAVGGGHLDVVKCLLPHCDATLMNSEALQLCVLNGEEEMFEALHPYSDCGAALNEVNTSLSLFDHDSHCLSLRDRLTEIVARQKQQATLAKAVAEHEATTRTKKM